jgi:hypothetical protein
MSDEEFEKEMVEMKVHLNVLMEFLQEYEEDQIWLDNEEEEGKMAFTAGEAKAKDVC